MEKNLSLIASRAYYGEGDDKALAINAEAKAKKEAGIIVTNASVGMLFGEDGKLATIDLINNELIKNLNNEGRSYPSVSGGKKFQEAVLKWFLLEDYENFTKSFKASVIASGGGTGALVIALRNYTELGQSVLIPDPGWANYRALISQNNAKPLSYSLFDENLNFNLTKLKVQIEEVAKKEGRLSIIINDPSHNPTGYTLSEAELDALINLLNDVSQNYPVCAIFDVAYIDYASQSRGRLIFKKLHSFAKGLIPLFCFSASKSLAFYGLRLGALVGIHKEEAVIDKFNLASIATARALWSCANAHAINTISSLFNDDALRLGLLDKISESRLMLETRGNLFTKEANLVNLPIFPYRSGFFVTIKASNANDLADRLKDKNVFVLPMQNSYIRVALSSLSLKQIKGLAKIIKDEM